MGPSRTSKFYPISVVFRGLLIAVGPEGTIDTVVIGDDRLVTLSVLRCQTVELKEVACHRRKVPDIDTRSVFLTFRLTAIRPG